MTEPSGPPPYDPGRPGLGDPGKGLSRRWKVVILAVVSVGALGGFGGIVAQGIYSHRHGCSVLPDSKALTGVMIRNDTQELAFVDDCQGASCPGGTQTDLVLKQGTETEVGGPCELLAAKAMSWRVLRADGTLRGYVRIHVTHQADEVVFRVSRAGASRDVATPAG